MTAVATPMPPADSAMGDTTDILDQLLEAMQANDNLAEAERDRIFTLAFMELIRQVRKLERTSIAGLFKQSPVKFISLGIIIFVLLHEFSTSLNLSIIIAAALRALGVPIS